jgi:predicted ATP-dependent endonuclease of OLD family
MRLISLHIKGYKNIQDLPLDFSNKDGITLLIGNNGVGKSNIIEAISSIFAGLYENGVHKTEFDYSISYKLNGNLIEISLTGDQSRILVNSIEISKTDLQRKAKEYLPENLIACYSGESLRLFDNYYKPYYKQYIDAIRKEDKIPKLPMLYVNKYNIKIALLTLFFCDWTANTDVANFCTNILHIKDLKKIKFHYNNRNILSWKRNAIVQMIENINAIDGKGFISPDACEFNSINDFKQKLNYLDERTFFHFMYAATMPLEKKAIEEIDIELELNNGTIITIEELSEGEKKYLLIKTILEIISTENSLILFDEPDAHIHISRKAGLKEIISLYNNRENIITTHSPTLVMCFDNSHLLGLGLDTNGHTISIDKDKVNIIARITEGMWSAHEQNAFLASNKPITLLVEGKTDKIHLESAFKHLRSSYPQLDFDVFYFGGADNIPQFLIGLKTCNIDYSNRKIIAVFDSDTEGIDCCNKTTVKFNGKKNKYGLYAITLPKSNATIENYYTKELFADAFLEVAKVGDFSNLITSESARILKQAKIKFSERIQQNSDATIFAGFRPIFDLIEKIRNL